MISTLEQVPCRSEFVCKIYKFNSTGCLFQLSFTPDSRVSWRQTGGTWFSGFWSATKLQLSSETASETAVILVSDSRVVGDQWGWDVTVECLKISSWVSIVLRTVIYDCSLSTVSVTKKTLGASLTAAAPHGLVCISHISLNCSSITAYQCHHTHFTLHWMYVETSRY